MTTFDAVPTFMSPTGDRPFAGLGALTRKELTEWRRGRRAWAVLAITSTLFALTASASWITEQVRLGLPPDVVPPAPPASLAAIDNLVIAVTTGVPVLAAIFAVMSLLVAERDAGTLAWTASKPVTLGSVWLSKWLTASLMLGVTAVGIPMLLTTALATLLYGAPPLGAVTLIAVGLLMTVTLYAAIGLAAATVVRSQAAVAAIGLGAYLLSSLMGGLVPGISPLLPTSVLAWAVGGAMGAAMSLITPVGWAIGVVVLVLLGMRRLAREAL